MSADVSSARELIAAAAKEVRAIAEEATGRVRKRLLVVAYVAEMAERELAADAAAGPAGYERLSAAIRAGEHDGELLELAGRLRPEVRGRLAVAHPGYDQMPIAPQ